MQREHQGRTRLAPVTHWPSLGLTNHCILAPGLYSSEPGLSMLVGQPPRAEICVPNMPSGKAKKLRKLPQEKVLLEL